MSKTRKNKYEIIGERNNGGIWEQVFGGDSSKLAAKVVNFLHHKSLSPIVIESKDGPLFKLGQFRKIVSDINEDHSEERFLEVVKTKIIVISF